MAERKKSSSAGSRGGSSTPRKRTSAAASSRAATAAKRPVAPKKPSGPKKPPANDGPAEANEEHALATVEAAIADVTERQDDERIRILQWPPVGYWMKVAIGILVIWALANMVVAIRQIIILIVVSLVLAIGLQPGVNWLEAKGMRRGSAVAFIFTTAFVVIVGFLATITPAIIRQIGGLVENAPEYLDRAQNRYSFFRDLNEQFDLRQKLSDLGKELPSTALSLVRSFTSFLFNALTVLILTLYFTTALPKMEAGIARLLRRDNREDFERILADSTNLVGGYILGNIVVSVIAGLVSFVALVIIGVPYPVALAFWVALADLIPTVGAILGAAVAVLVSIFAGVPQLIATSIFFLVYQQIENYVIAPRVMTRTVQMSAAAVIVAVLIGGTLAGFPGALLALPVAAIIKVTVNRLYLESRMEAVRIADEADDHEHRRRLRFHLRRHH